MDVSAGRAGRPARSSRRRRDQRAQQGGRRRVGQRCARRIVDVDGPAPEFGGDPARELAVGRDQGGGLPSSFSVSRNAKAIDQCFLMGRRAIGARHMLERRCAAARPGLGGLCRPHQFGDQQMPRRSAAARPVGDVVALTPERLQEFAQAELRMRFVELFPASPRPCRGRGQAIRSRPAAVRRWPTAARAWPAASRSNRRRSPAWPAGARASAPPGRGSPGCAVRWRRSGRVRPAPGAMPRRRWRGTSGCAASGWRSCPRPGLPVGRTRRLRWQARRAVGRARAPA